MRNARGKTWLESSKPEPLLCTTSRRRIWSIVTIKQIESKDINDTEGQECVDTNPRIVWKCPISIAGPFSSAGLLQEMLTAANQHTVRIKFKIRICSEIYLYINKYTKSSLFRCATSCPSRSQKSGRCVMRAACKSRGKENPSSFCRKSSCKKKNYNNKLVHNMYAYIFNRSRNTSESGWGATVDAESGRRGCTKRRQPT